MFRHTSLTVVVALVIGASFASSVSAATATYEGGVFRYREQAGEKVEFFDLALRAGKAGGMGAYLWGFTSTAVNAGRGCRAGPSEEFFEVVCPLDASSRSARAPRYRISLNERDNNVDIVSAGLSGVICSPCPPRPPRPTGAGSIRSSPTPATTPPATSTRAASAPPRRP
jgi:hypothetical protein